MHMANTNLDFCFQSGRDELGSNIQALKKKITGEE